MLFYVEANYMRKFLVIRSESIYIKFIYSMFMTVTIYILIFFNIQSNIHRYNSQTLHLHSSSSSILRSTIFYKILKITTHNLLTQGQCILYCICWQSLIHNSANHTYIMVWQILNVLSSFIIYAPFKS